MNCKTGFAAFSVKKKLRAAERLPLLGAKVRVNRREVVGESGEKSGGSPARSRCKSQLADQ
jgi:hypothetical protein